MSNPGLIRQIAFVAGFALCSPDILATTPGEFDEISACLKRMPVQITPKQAGAEGKIPMSGVALFHFGDGIAADLTYRMDLLFFDGKWMYSVLRITQQNGGVIESGEGGLFDRISLYFNHQFGPANHYTITSDIREDSEPGSTNRCVFWRNDKTGFEIDLDYQGKNAITLNLCVTSLDYYSSVGFLGDRIRGFYNDQVFPAAGVLPDGFPSNWNPGGVKSGAASKPTTDAIRDRPEDGRIAQADRHLGNSSVPDANAWYWLAGAGSLAAITGGAIWLLNKTSNKINSANKPPSA